MDEWNVLDRQTNSEDYQPIICDNNGLSSNFSVTVIAVLKNSIERRPLTSVKSCIQSPFICIYFDNVLIAISSEKCQLKLFKTFESNIERLLILKNTSISIIALENGNLIIVNLATGQHHNTEINVPKDNFVSSLMYEQYDGTVIIVNSKGILYNHYLVSFFKSEKDIKYNIKSISHKEIYDESRFDIELKLKHIKSIYESSLCIQILANKKIGAFCPITGQSYILSDTINASDIKPFENSNKILYTESVDGNKYNLHIASCFDFNSFLSTNVSKNCVIVGGVGNNALFTDSSDDKLSIYLIQEISPISQLEILISLRNYEAAELFAKSHNLSPAAVLEIKAKCLMISLKKSFSNETFEELHNVLSSCENVEFIIDCCIDGIETNIELWPLLEFAKKKLINFDNVHLNTKVDKLLWKIETYRLFNNEDVDWQIFINDDPLNICKKFLNNDLLDQAAVVWLKSYRFLYQDLKVDDVMSILSSISRDIKLNSLLWWLEYFIPNIVNIIPHCTDLIIDWAKDRICILENSPHWPEVGIQFAEKFSSVAFSAKGVVTIVPPSADKIFSLIQCMKQIQILKKSYNILISLRDFTTLSASELTKLILRKSFNEDLQTLFTDYLDNFMLRHNLNHDILIREYIEELLGSSPTLDEQRMLILIENIFNINEKYQCIILILKSASIPWSLNIKKISEDVIASKHPLSSRVYAEILRANLQSILVKYKCVELSSEDYTHVIDLIIESGTSEMMTDIETITKVYSSLKEDAYLSCIKRYIEIGNILSALNIYNSMDECFKEICFYHFSSQLEAKLKSHIMNKVLEYNYIDFLKCISPFNNHDLDCFDKIFILKNKFQLYILLEEYHVKEYRKCFLNRWCQERNSKQLKDIDMKETLLLTIEIGSYLSLTKTECIIILLGNINHNLLTPLAEIIMSDKYYLDTNVDSLKIIVELIPLINIDNVIYLNNANDCITNIIQNCHSKYIPYCLEVHNWLSSFYFAHKYTKELLSLWKISSFYNPHAVNSIMPIWRDIFFRNNSDNFKIKVISVCSCPSNQQCQSGSNCLQNLLTNLQQNDIYSMKIIAHCANWHIQNNLEIPAWLLNIKEMCVKNLITKIIINERPDHLFVSNLMFTLVSRNEWLNAIFESYGSNTKKTHFSRHILACKNVYQLSNVPYKQAYNVHLQNNIENKLESYGFALKDNQQNSMQTLIALLETLVNVKSFSIEILQEYCLIANINVDEALTSYLFLTLKLWQNDYKFIDYNFGNCKIISNYNMNDMLQKCLNITSKIICKNELVENLITLFKNGEIQISNITVNISCYCYEAYLLILDLVKHLTGTQNFLREYLLLKFLQTYQRVSKPKQIEIDEFSLKETFPKIGFYRLPFQSLISENFWNNLKPEVTLATYKQWLPIAGLLMLDNDVQVSRDMICSNAVKQSMTIEKTTNKDTNITWSLYMKNKQLLEDAHKCIECISNLEWAGACFYYVYQGSSLGADQVAAADFCYQFAEHWAKIEPNNNAVKKMQMKHLLTSSAHILHKYNLGEDKLLSLCDNPHKLIEALYNHKSIITNYECSNINNAVNEIAEKHNLNYVLIKMQIFARILSTSNMAHFSDSSLTDKYVSTSDGSLNNGLLMRACYILKDTNLTSTILYLQRIGLNTESIENYSKSIRALQCLLSLVNGDLMMDVLQCTTKDIWLKLWEMYFINGLYLTGFEYLTSVFHENKTHLIQQMCCNTRDHNKLTILLIVKMIFVYNIQISDSTLEELSKCIIKFNMIMEVKEFLLSSRIAFSGNYINIWNHVLLTPFKMLDSPLIDQQRNDCCESLRFLPICPVVSQIDLFQIVNNCVRLNVTEFALIILPYLSDKNKKIAKNKIGKIKKSALQELKLLRSKGVLMTNTVMSILKQND